MQEQIEHEILKNSLKLCIINNPQFNDMQKQQAIHRIDQAAMQADWINNLLKICGFIR